ncbi:hypothetical protein [Actinotalea sp.]|uniref:hypothetical protein n=1 Tax=Actinotalea sp. TaxID=1872145 RepID=UPI00356A0107
MDPETRHVRNREQPASVPVAPMGDVPVIARVVWSDGLEEWRPARAVRWTRSHVMVGWREDPDPSPRRRSSGSSRGSYRSGDGTPGGAVPAPPAERWVWLRAADVMRSVSWLVAPDRVRR